jgi:PAS domain S-box-containing protein
MSLFIGFGTGGNMKRSPVRLSSLQDINFLSQYKDRIELLMAILESSYDGIYITDGQAKTIWCNRSYEVVSGLDRKEVIGRYMQEMVNAKVISRSATLIVLDTRGSVTIEQDFKTGKRAVVTSTPLFDENDNIIMVITNVRDISELYDLKEQLAQNSELNRRYQTEIEIIRRQVIGYDDFVAKDKKMLELLRIVNRVAGLDTTVLLLGETGVGKEGVATYILKNSARRDKHFIKVNCAAITPTLMESELFGYMPGAFTGANKNGKMGLFEVANNGTIFLDEVGELPYNIQAKLLRALQEQEVLRIGSDQPIKINVRILAATNRNLQEMVAKRRFREDLYYRLNVFPVTIPPLRDRREDIPALAQHMLDKLNQKYGISKSFTPAALDRLLQYSWPGNVRELKNVVERTFIMSGESKIVAADLPLQNGWNVPDIEWDGQSGAGLKEILERVEKKYIMRAHESFHNVRTAARSLGMDPATYFRKRKKYEET